MKKGLGMMDSPSYEEGVGDVGHPLLTGGLEGRKKDYETYYYIIPIDAGNSQHTRKRH